MRRNSLHLRFKAIPNLSPCSSRETLHSMDAGEGHEHSHELTIWV